MFIFRVEHDRNLCDDYRYSVNGSSITGHGTFMKCNSAREADESPNFGLCGEKPINLESHERCAVTAEQFQHWIPEDYLCACKNTSEYCEGGSFCFHCIEWIEGRLYLPDGWNIVCYWVEDNAYDIDWRIDNKQIVFDPAKAILVGFVNESEVYAMLAVAV